MHDEHDPDPAPTATTATPNRNDLIRRYVGACDALALCAAEWALYHPERQAGQRLRAAAQYAQVHSYARQLYPQIQPPDPTLHPLGPLAQCLPAAADLSPGEIADALDAEIPF